MDLSVNKVFSNIKSNFANNNKVHFCRANNEPQDDSFVKSDIDVKFGFAKDKLSGEIDGMPFELSHGLRLMKSDAIKGSINNKNVDLNYKRGFFSATDKVSGTIGDKALDLKIKHKFWGGLKISGTYNGQELNYNVKEGLMSYRINGDNTDLQVKGKNILSNDFGINGKFNDDKELLPLLLDVLNTDRQELN